VVVQKVMKGVLMKALVLTQYSHFEIQDVPCPDPGDHEVLVAVRACGICGSDVHGMDGSTGRRVPPIIMGHEASGVIVKKGKAVDRWEEGARVTFDSTLYCGTCHFCRRGSINLCENRRVLGVSCDEYRRDGAFAEYVALPEHIVYSLPNEVTFEEAALVEPLSVALHAVIRSGVCLGDCVLVVGTGVIGLLIVQVLKTVGARKIFAVDVDSNRLVLAEKLGADVCLNAQQEDVRSVILGETDSRGVDHAFEAVGNEAGFGCAVASVRKGGTVTMVGNISPQVVLPLQHAVTRELSLLGSCASAGEYPRCLGLIASKAVSVSPLISAVAKLEEGPVWFDLLYKRSGALLKVLLTP